MSSDRWRKGKPFLFLLLPGGILLFVFLVIPLFWIFRVSFYEHVSGGYMKAAWIMDNYLRFLLDPWYLKNVLWFSFEIAMVTSVIAVVLAYPISICIVKSNKRLKQLLFTLTLSPLLIGMVCLIFGWIVIFRGHGLLNMFTMWMGITSEPVKYMYSTKGVIICMVYISIPYVVLSLLDSLGRINPSLEEAAMNVGANRWRTFFSIVLPLSMPGMYAGFLIVFALNFCAFAVPLMVGSERTSMIGLLIYNEAMQNSNMPFAAAMSVILVVSSLLILLGFSKVMSKYIFHRLGH